MNKCKKYFLFILLPTIFLISFSGCSNDKDNHNKDTYWTCPMHHQVISDKPGSCPICHMELIQKTRETNKSVDTSKMEGMLDVSSGRLALAGVEIAKVERHTMNNSFKSFSYLDFIEGRREVISARVSGRIEKLYVKNTGEYVYKGAPLFEIYSPELVAAQNDFLIALNSNKSNVGLLDSTNSNIDLSRMITSSRKKLELMGLTKKQIQKLEQEKELNYTIIYYADANGVVIEKNIQNGMYVNEGSKLFEIADLSKLWNISEVFEKDISSIKVGGKVKVTLRSLPGEVFQGIVTMIYPLINEQSRTIQIRSEVINEGNKLKPQMYGETTFELGVINSLFIPEAAVLQTGKRNIVWIRTSDGMFEAKEIQIGSIIDNMYQVLEGLSEGDEVVAKGAYLIDSESQLTTGKASGHQHETEAEKKDNKESSKHNN